MKRIFMAAAVVIAVALSNCNAGSSGDPKTVLVAFFEALSKKDFTAAKKLATKDSEGMFSMMEMGMKMAKDSKDDGLDKFDKNKMIFGEPKIEGDKATVEVKDKDKGEAVNFIMKKEGGSWKVAFDKASMMQMGAEKMNEKGVDGAEALDKLKDMNMDSITNKMQEGLDKLKEMKEKNPEAAKQLEDAMKNMQEAAEKVKQ